MKTSFSPEIAQLLCDYMAATTSLQKRRIKKKIYSIEIKSIHDIVKNNMDEIIKKLYDAENSRIYINTADYLLSDKKFSHRKFNGTIDPRSLQNNIARYKYTRLLKMLSDEHTNSLAIARKIEKLSVKERAFISHISGANLEVFNIIT